MAGSSSRAGPDREVLAEILHRIDHLALGGLGLSRSGGGVEVREGAHASSVSSSMGMAAMVGALSARRSSCCDVYR